MILTLQERIDCPASYCTDDNPHLLCGYDGQCDGNLYECCVWEREELGFRAHMEVSDAMDNSE